MRDFKSINCFVVLVFSLLFQISGKAQSDSVSVNYFLLGESEDKSIDIYIGKNSFRYFVIGIPEGAQSFDKIIMILNDTKDTCVIATSDYVTKFVDSIHIKSILIDNNKRKAIAITFYMYELSNLGEHGGYIIHKTVNEIWDIQQRKKIFSATSMLHFNSNYFEYYDDTTASMTRYTDYRYKYDFSIINNEIVIRGAVVECKEKYNEETEWNPISEAHAGYLECELPEHEEGVYFYHKGKYILRKNKKRSR